MSIDELRTFLGWCSVINVGLLVFSSVMILLARPLIAKMHGKLFRLDEQTLNAILYGWLGLYKIGIYLFNLVPYVALWLMQQ